MKLTNLSASSSNLSFLLKGPWGYGKTVAAASFAKLGPVHISYWDKKAPIELVQFYKQHDQQILHNIEYEVYGAHNAGDYLNHLIKLAKDCRYVAVITDSVTNMTSGAVNWSLGFRDNKKNQNKDKIIPDFDEYKVETSLVTQALDICRTLPCHVIWIAHPVPGIKIEGSGSSMKVTKVNPIVTYGNKVAGIIPGQFSEIYHFSKLSEWDSAAGRSRAKYLVSTEQIGDDYAKSNLGLSCEMDITNKLFYDVWKSEVSKLEEKLSQIKDEPANPFASLTTVSTNKAPWEK